MIGRIALLSVPALLMLAAGYAAADQAAAPGLRANTLQLTTASPAEGPPGPAMAIAFDQGRYDEAVSHAADLDTADAHAFKARALLAKGMCGEGQPAADLLDLARHHAERALELDAGHVEGRLQLAITRSLMARPLSTRAAYGAGHGRAARTLTESVLEEDPTNAYAHGMMAVWHIEVLRRGGRMGGLIMGADLKSARRHYAAAIAAQPGDASIHWQYARALAALNPKRHRDEIAAALHAALAAPVDSQLEAVMASRAETLDALYRAGDPKAVKAAAEELL